MQGYEWFLAICSCAIGIILGFFIAAAAFPSDLQRKTVVCEHLEGEWVEKVCIRDNRVIEIKDTE